MLFLLRAGGGLGLRDCFRGLGLFWIWGLGVPNHSWVAVPLPLKKHEAEVLQSKV